MSLALMNASSVRQIANTSPAAYNLGILRSLTDVDDIWVMVKKSQTQQNNPFVVAPSWLVLGRRRLTAKQMLSPITYELPLMA